MLTFRKIWIYFSVKKKKSQITQIFLRQSISPALYLQMKVLIES